MIDTYLVSADFQPIMTYCAAFANVIGPMPGRPAKAEETLEDGSVSPAEPPAGDPAHFYACVRSDAPLVPVNGFSLCDAQTGQAVVGVWS